MIWRQESLISLLKSLNVDGAGWRSLEIPQLDDIGLYTATTEKLPNLIIAASTFVKNQINPAPFHVLTFYASARLILRELRGLFNDHRTDFASELLSFWTLLCPIRSQEAFPFCRCFSAVYICISMTKGTRKELQRFGLKIVSAGLSRTCRSFSRTLIPHGRRCW